MDKIRKYLSKKKGSEANCKPINSDAKNALSKGQKTPIVQKPPLPRRSSSDVLLLEAAAAPSPTSRRPSLPRVSTPTRPTNCKGTPSISSGSSRRSRSQDPFNGLPPIDNTRNMKSILKQNSNSDENLSKKIEVLVAKTKRPRPKGSRVSRSLENVCARITTSLPQGSKFFEEAMEELRPPGSDSLEDLDTGLQGGSLGERQGRKRVRVEHIFLQGCYSLPGSPRTYPKHVHWETKKV